MPQERHGKVSLADLQSRYSSADDLDKLLFIIDPDEALRQHRQTIKSRDEALALAQEAIKLNRDRGDVLDEVLALARELRVSRDVTAARIKRRFTRLKRRYAKLEKTQQNQLAALAKNRLRGTEAIKKRAATSMKAIIDHVTARLKRSPHFTKEELAKEIQSESWYRKNKKGKPYSNPQLLRDLPFYIKKAKAAIREQGSR